MARQNNQERISVTVKPEHILAMNLVAGDRPVNYSALIRDALDQVYLGVVK